jgi:predicted TIM-barrel fold metal-dependent hydrolase
VETAPFTVRRAVAGVVALCAGALLVAITATAAVQWARPGLFHAGPLRSAPLPLPRLDAHQHLTPGTIDLAIRIAELQGIGALVNLSGGAEGGTLEAQLAAARPYGERVVVFMNPDPRGCCDDAWAVREAARAARGRALGARGLSVEIAPGLDLTAASTRPLFEACAALGLPVAVSAVGAPDALAALAARHPLVTFVGAHFAERPDDPAAVRRLMDELPNLWIDLAGRVAELGQRSDVTRAAILAHPDRVLFGTDARFVESGASRGIVLGAGDPILLDDDLLGGQERRVFFDATLRFLESRDPGLPDPIPRHDLPGPAGLGLPRAVLDRLYHQNAERLLHLRTVRAQG